MAKKVLAVARSRISIGSATDAWTLAAAGADTYTPIGGVRSMPNFGDTYQSITVDEVSDGRTRKGKGTANAGGAELTMSRRRDDPGQISLVAASRSFDAYNFKIEIPQGGGKYEVNYVSALVMGRQKGLGGPNDTQTLIANLEISEEPLEVPTLADGLGGTIPVPANAVILRDGTPLTLRDGAYLTLRAA